MAKQIWGWGVIDGFNILLVIVGLGYCSYLMLSRRYDTRNKAIVSQLCMWVALWICLMLAASPGGFEPVPLTTAARTLALIINIWHFESTLTKRKTIDVCRHIVEDWRKDHGNY